MNKEKKEPTKVIPLRIPAALVEKMKAIATKEGRSQHGNFIFAIEQWYKKQK
jgi:hypothetical protein